MALSVKDRVNLLAQAGYGFSPETIAAMIGVTVQDVVDVLTTPSAAPADPFGGGGATAKSAILAWATRTQNGGGLAFVTGDVVKDEIGLSISTNHELWLPKGYYSASLFVNPLNFPTDQGGSGDEWNLAVLSNLAGGFHANQAVPPNPNQGPVVYQSISGTAASIADQALQTAFLFESADQDLHSLSSAIPVGTFAGLALFLSATDVTTGASLWQGTVGYTEVFDTNVLLQLQQFSKS